MKPTTYKTFEEAASASKSRDQQGSAIVIGNFDGVHRGHQRLIEHAVKLAQSGEHAPLRVIALTFWPHPVRYFRPTLESFEIMTLDQRVDTLGTYGVEEVFAIPFDKGIASQTPEEFVIQALVTSLCAREVIVGEDFHFGHKRSGNVESLTELGKKHGFNTHAIPLLDDHGEHISSTRIRTQLKEGALDEVTRLMGRPYTLTGKVIHGDARGRELGYPTANTQVEQEVHLPDGIYTTTLETERYGSLQACTYIGSRPTYEEAKGRNVETFVLNVPQTKEGFDLYESRVQIKFHVRQRGDMAFSSSEELIAQMDRDVEQARQWHQGQP